jgi:hypothetical protein
MDKKGFPPGFYTALNFPLVGALLGRRSRRFSIGAAIPDGPLAFASLKEPFPLTELEQMMILTAAAGNTGWHYLIMRNEHYAPHLSNYAAAAGGRTFPSAAGFHTSEIFFTNDEGVYFFPTRDAPALAERTAEGSMDLAALLQAHQDKIRKLSDGRLVLPPQEPYVEGHNTWCVNRPGSLLVIPVGDLAQHHLLYLCYLVQNGYCITDDINREMIPGIERFRNLVNLEEPLPLTFSEQVSLAECCEEMSISCFSGTLMLQAMGLGGWMFDGVNPFAVLGTMGDPEAPGLGFRYDTDERWGVPNPTGLTGVFEGYCPPHYPDMRAAVEALAVRKFGPGGPFHQDTPGPWKDSSRVRRSAQIHNDEFKECVALMAQYVYDRFGKFPGTVPSIVTLTYLQAHHLDLDFYNHYFKSGAYLETHARHMELWHPTEEKQPL